MRAVLLSAMMAAAAISGPALAKLPPPSDEAKAKAAEAAAKSAWSAKVEAHKVCEIEDRLAKAYHASVKDAPAAMPTPACVQPGPAPGETKPLEASGAHSPPATATSPPSTNTPAAHLPEGAKK